MSHAHGASDADPFRTISLFNLSGKKVEKRIDTSSGKTEKVKDLATVEILGDFFHEEEEDPLFPPLHRVRWISVGQDDPDPSIGEEPPAGEDEGVAFEYERDDDGFSDESALLPDTAAESSKGVTGEDEHEARYDDGFLDHNLLVADLPHAFQFVIVPEPNPFCPREDGETREAWTRRFEECLAREDESVSLEQARSFIYDCDHLNFSRDSYRLAREFFPAPDPGCVFPSNEDEREASDAWLRIRDENSAAIDVEEEEDDDDDSDSEAESEENIPDSYYSRSYAASDSESLSNSEVQSPTSDSSRDDRSSESDDGGADDGNRSSSSRLRDSTEREPSCMVHETENAMSTKDIRSLNEEKPQILGELEESEACFTSDDESSSSGSDSEASPHSLRELVEERNGIEKATRYIRQPLVDYHQLTLTEPRFLLKAYPIFLQAVFELPRAEMRKHARTSDGRYFTEILMLKFARRARRRLYFPERPEEKREEEPERLTRAPWLVRLLALSNLNGRETAEELVAVLVSRWFLENAYPDRYVSHETPLYTLLNDEHLRTSGLLEMIAQDLLRTREQDDGKRARDFCASLAASIFSAKAVKKQLKKAVIADTMDFDGVSSSNFSKVQQWAKGEIKMSGNYVLKRMIEEPAEHLPRVVDCLTLNLELIQNALRSNFYFYDFWANVRDLNYLKSRAAYPSGLRTVLVNEFNLPSYYAKRLARTLDLGSPLAGSALQDVEDLWNRHWRWRSFGEREKKEAYCEGEAESEPEATGGQRRWSVDVAIQLLNEKADRDELRWQNADGDALRPVTFLIQTEEPEWVLEENANPLHKREPVAKKFKTLNGIASPGMQAALLDDRVDKLTETPPRSSSSSINAMTCRVSLERWEEYCAARKSPTFPIQFDEVRRFIGLADDTKTAEEWMESLKQASAVLRAPFLSASEEMKIRAVIAGIGKRDQFHQIRDDSSESYSDSRDELASESRSADGPDRRW
ncbi:unnamed protein product [Amoebophrya sp. A120]|nr:unnamed protein product [Amoebophrya sp. A120]|eukprot:GSA120T00005806001.1